MQPAIRNLNFDLSQYAISSQNGLSARQEGPGVLGPVILPNFIMQVWRGRSAGHSDKADNVPSLYSLSDFNQLTREVTVTSRQTIAMIDDDKIAVSGFSLGINDNAVGRGVYRGIEKRRDVEAKMHFLVSAKRIGAAAIVTGDRALHRPDIGSETDAVGPLGGNLFQQR